MKKDYPLTRAGHHAKLIKLWMINGIAKKSDRSINRKLRRIAFDDPKNIRPNGIAKMRLIHSVCKHIWNIKYFIYLCL